MANIITHGLGNQPKSDAQLLEIFKRFKGESFDQRWVFERQWIRNLYYLLGRQWIYWEGRRGEWRDKRLAKWVPRPVTNKCLEVQDSIAAMFAAINLGTNARPVGNSPKNIITAGVADDYAPILHQEHRMDHVMGDFDFWLIATGFAALHTYVDKDVKYGVVEDPLEQCVACGNVYPLSENQKNGNKCPDCGGIEFQPAVDETGEPIPANTHPNTRGTTDALSPLELAFPLSYAHWDQLPYVFRLRFRDKYYYEQHPELKSLVSTINWTKAPAERTMQIFRSLPLQNDLGIQSSYGSMGSSTDADGVSEYDLYIKPCSDFPDGQVIRFAGDHDPVIIHSETEGLPGPLPYHDAKGNPLFTFSAGVFRKIGGRIYGSSALDPMIQRQNDLNQLDSMISMIAMRMSNPIWLEPKGAEVEKFTGEPGLVVKWNPLVAGGQAKPERIKGEDIPQTLTILREQYMKDIEEATGTYDALKGAKPTGVEAFSALQLLVERGQSRFAKPFKARGTAYCDWFKFALEIEREFGPDERTKEVMSPTKGWTFDTFKRTQLEGCVNIIVEDGTLAPKTALGRRAALEHARQLGLLDFTNPDQQYAGLQTLGLTEFVPGLDVQVQAALQNQEMFEQWIVDPAAIQATQQQAQVELANAQSTGMPPTPMFGPLKFRKWYEPRIHRQEFIKWVNGDTMRELLKQHPEAEGMLEGYLTMIGIALVMETQGLIDSGGVILDAKAEAAGPEQNNSNSPAPGGGGQAMANSNQNSAPAGNTPQPAAA